MATNATAPVKKTKLISNYRLTRQKLNLNQAEFWSRLGVTQSGGSRYESGRNVPKPTQTVIDLAYGTTKSALKKLADLRGVSVDELLSSQAK